MKLERQRQQSRVLINNYLTLVFVLLHNIVYYSKTGFDQI